MKYLNLFEDFNFDIEPSDVHGNDLEVIIDDQDFSFKVIDGEVSFSSEDDYERAFELGIELDDELKSYILDEYKKMSDKTRMRRFGFFKESLEEVERKTKFIIDTIDNEVKKSKEFGLDIDKEDIDYEKEIVTTIILRIWDKIKTCSSNEYTQLMTSTINDLSNHFHKQSLDYRERTKNSNVKNMYQVHISSIIHSLFMRIDNNLF